MTDYESMLAILERTFGKVDAPNSGLRTKKNSYIHWDDVTDDGPVVVEMSFHPDGSFEGFSSIQG